MNSVESTQPQATGRQALRALRQGETRAMADWLRAHLFEHVLPFWEPLVDRERGGLFTCVQDDGAIVSRDKWLWSQWRSVWVYARIFNTIDRAEKWRDRAVATAQFCLQHGWLKAEGGWALLLDESGRVKRGVESIYVDAFAVYGLVELAAATQDKTWLAAARETADAAVMRIETLGDGVPHFPYLIPPDTKPHGIPMIWSLKLAGLAAATGEQKYADLSRAMMREVWTDFYETKTDRVFETVRRDGGRFAGPAGDVTVPGHVVEGLWFQRLIATQLGEAPVAPAETWRMIARHLDLGWEAASGGGLLLAVDGTGGAAGPEAWGFGDTKLWWPQTEALFASLLGWHETGDAGWLDRYDAFWELSWAHYVDWAHGEWRQKLNRDLTPFTGTIALPVKDPFHLPRSLILQIELLANNRPPRVATVKS